MIHRYWSTFRAGYVMLRGWWCCSRKISSFSAIVVCALKLQRAGRLEGLLRTIYKARIFRLYAVDILGVLFIIDMAILDWRQRTHVFFIILF